MLLLALVARLACCTHPAPTVAPPTAVTSGTAPAPAGTLRGGTLELRVVATMARWHPGAENGPYVDVAALAEEGKAPSVPGPLIRVPVGTRIELRMRNTLRDTLVARLMCVKRCGDARQVRIAPGATGSLRAEATVAGAFVYGAAVIVHGETSGAGGQMRGAVLVDQPGAPREQLMLLTAWQVLKDSSDASKGERVSFAINGKVWPYTSRLSYSVGDSVRWRLVNLDGGSEHPMHLHGFYFRVLSRGDGDSAWALPSASQPLEVTETIAPFHSVVLAWSPDRPGNWVLHCHRPFHVAPERDDDILGKGWSGARDVHDNHALTGMGALVMGITVHPRREATLAGEQPGPAAERLRLLVHRRDHVFGPDPAYGYVIQHGAPPTRDSVVVPTPPLIVHRGVPTEITVVNEADEATAVHWHGIELESYYDGVAGWSGAMGRLAPAIAAGDSFVARFTPPRAGTFIYHTHLDDIKQLSGGLYGALIVLEPGERWNDTTDHVFALGVAGTSEDAPDVVNGRAGAPVARWKAGVTHRLRFLSMTIDDEADVSLEREDGKLAEWVPVAKDAYPVPPDARVSGEAKFYMNPGETFDFEATLAPGTYFLRVRSYTNVLLTIEVK